MEHTETLNQLESDYNNYSISDEEYLDRIVNSICNANGFNSFLDCLYEYLYDEDHAVSLVNRLTDDQLKEHLKNITHDCTNQVELEIQACLALLSRMLNDKETSLLIRWSISRLVGIAVIRRGKRVQ